MARKVDEASVVEFWGLLSPEKLRRHHSALFEKRISQQPLIKKADDEITKKIRSNYVFDGTELDELKDELILQYGGDPSTRKPVYSGATTEAFTAKIPDIKKTFRIKMAGKQPTPPHTVKEGLDEILKNNDFKEELLEQEMPGYTLTLDWSDYYQVQHNAHPFDEALRSGNWKVAADAWKSFWGKFHFDPKLNTGYGHVCNIPHQAKFNTYLITEALHRLINQIPNKERRFKWTAAVDDAKAGLINKLKIDTLTTNCFTDGKASNYFFLYKQKDTWSCTTMGADDMGWKTPIRNIRKSMEFDNKYFYTGLPHFDLGVYLESIEGDAGLSHVVSYLSPTIETFIAEGMWVVNDDIVYDLRGKWDPFVARKGLNMGKSYVKIGRARKAANAVAETYRFIKAM